MAQPRLVVPASQFPLQRQHQAVRLAVRIDLPLARFHGAPVDAQRLARQARLGRHAARIARIIFAANGQDQARLRRRRRACLHLVFRVQIFHRSQVAATELEGALAEEGHLLLRGQVVDLARVILAASAIRRHGRHRQRWQAAAGRIGIAGQALAAIGRRIEVIAGEGGAAGERQSPLGNDAGPGKIAVLRGQHILLVVVEHAENIVAVRVELAETRRQVDAVLAAALVLGRDHLGGDVRDVDGALGDEVDDAANGVRAVDGRGAVAQHFDPFQGGDGNDVQVDAGAVIGMVGDAPAVEQDQRLVAAQAAQVGAGLAARGQAAGIAADGIAAAHARRIRGDLAQHFLGRRQALFGEILGLEDGQGRGRFRGEALDGGTGDFDPLHGGRAGCIGFLRHGRMAIRAQQGGAQQAQGRGGTAGLRHLTLL